VNRAIGFDSQTAQVTFVVIDHEIYCMVIRTVPLLWYEQFLAKVKATITGKLLDSQWLNCAYFNMAYCVIRCENYRH
jgi:hypothetical protein